MRGALPHPDGVGLVMQTAWGVLLLDNGTKGSNVASH
ncbi:hypothetical protein F383_23105 [Gossypium arboreum]|uniref:Uncharacterized protein n=1 Tax=Gossypium arboreum TaxID=29729 RepID=A0A0B0P3Z2_GOSAR|nr:hypothetical protein F383_23105 [Gossypium arboreum]